MFWQVVGTISNDETMKEGKEVDTTGGPQLTFVPVDALNLDSLKQPDEGGEDVEKNIHDSIAGSCSPFVFLQSRSWSCC